MIANVPASESPEFRSTERFELIRRLGSGGMGVVYEALDLESNHRVALKTLRNMTPSMRLRFKNEFRSLAHLAHPNLVSLGELHEVDGWLFFTMELLRGVDFLHHVRPDDSLPARQLVLPCRSPWDTVTSRDTTTTDMPVDWLDQALRKEGTPERPDDKTLDRVELGGERPAATLPGFDEARLRAATVQLVKGVHALHDAGKVHRDIKPSNVLVTDEDRVVLVDFGLVSDFGRDRITESNRLIGTVRYMAPEQARHAEVGPAADWYSVGAVLYMALTGAAPFDGPVHAVLRAKASIEPIPPALRAGGVPRDLGDLCVDLLRIDPDQRPGGAEILARLATDTAVAEVLTRDPVTPAGGDDVADSPRSGPHPLPAMTRPRSHSPSLDERFPCGSPGERGVAPAAGRPAGHGAASDWPASETQRRSFPPDRPGAGFVGRGQEMHALDQALFDAGPGNPIAFIIHGESGVGKTALLRRFAERASHDREVTVLHGCCYQRESVAYKGVDELIDELAGHLCELPSDVVETLVPKKRAGLLVQLFPVLRGVPGLPAEPEPDAARLPRHLQRALAFAALRELIGNLAGEQTLVLAIDDLQWSDADSLALISEILRPPGAPSVLFMATLRTSSGTSVGPWDVAALRSAFRCAVRPLELGSLPPPDARALVEQLTGDSSGGGVDVEMVVEESGGHPLFLDVLVRHHAAEWQHQPHDNRLDEAMWWHISRLDELERDILALLCASGRPIAREILATLVAGDRASFDRCITSLVGAHLVASGGSRSSDVLDVFHHRIRDAVLGHTTDTHREDLHRRLALALEERGDADPELLATHWLAAGDDERAAGYYEIAAESARAILAFDRSARLYQRCLELYPSEQRSLDLRVTLANALVDAGRSAQASREYLAAASLAEPLEALDLERRAAEHLLRSGRADEGIAILRQVMHAVGLRMPRSPRRALFRLLAQRLLLALRGRRHASRTEAELPALQLMRIDTCWAAATSLPMFNPLIGLLFQTQHLALALDAGEPIRIARAMAVEAGYATTAGGFARERGARVVGGAMELAEKVGDPRALAWAASAQGASAYLLGEWRQARDKCAEAERLLLAVMTGTRWEIDVMRQFEASSMSMMGDFPALHSMVPARIREAEEREDVYAAAILRSGHINAMWLADDDPALARHHACEAVARFPKGDFYLAHYYDMIAQAQIDLYEGDAAGALARVEAAWPSFRRSHIARVQIVRIMAVYLRARVHLAAARNGSARDRARAIRLAERCVRKLGREKMQWATSLAESVRAACACYTGDVPAAIAALAAASQDAVATDMGLYAAGARYARGALLGGDEGAAMIAEAEGWLAGQGVRNPARFASVFVPGIPQEGRGLLL